MNDFLIVNDYSPFQMIIVIKKDNEFFAIQWSKLSTVLAFLFSIGILIISQDIVLIVLLPTFFILALCGFLVGGIFNDKIIWISELETDKIKKCNFLQNPKEYLNNILEKHRHPRINSDYYEKIENFLYKF